MAHFTRRKFMKVAGGTAAVGLAGVSPSLALAGQAHVVVIGGGYAGGVAAKYIRMLSGGKVKVTLVEKDKYYYSCPLSNWVIAGFRDIEAQKWSWAKAADAHGYSVVHDEAVGIDAKAKTVKLRGGSTLNYDRLIVAPGVGFKKNIEGYDTKAMVKMPHAWKAGLQTTLLAKQMEAMPDGGTAIVVPPENPFRCPPGPYERVSLMAWYIKRYKPKSKVLVLDPKDKFSKFGLFTGGWKELYGYGTDNSIIEWVAAGQGGKVTAVDADNMTVMTDMDEFKGDVVSVIPNNTAGAIAHSAGLTNGGDWCSVNKQTFESTSHPGVHVIGDSSIAAKMPKSGYAANSQAKVVADAVVQMLAGKEPGTGSYVNTCYSMLSPDYGISVAAVYKLKGDTISKVGGGLSPGKASAAYRKVEADNNESWYQSIMADTFT
ncbi:MAG: FAD-dependent oxidoreductase [Magnetococcales bacterium]|nr:FAD-dependent oxidoreductase [Magnetococcales bacterium]